MSALLFVAALLLCAACQAGSGLAIVTRDDVALRTAPNTSAPAHVTLWAGDLVEVRGERHDYLLVYDRWRARGGFVRSTEVQLLEPVGSGAPDLLSVLRTVRGQPGNEALGLGYAAAFMEIASDQALHTEAGIEVLDTIGTLADRLARRASDPVPPVAPRVLAAHLEVAERYGVRFVTYEHAGRTRVCYDGAAFRRVLAMGSTPEQRDRATVALTRPDCVSGGVSPLGLRVILWTRLGTEAGQEATTRSRPARSPPRTGVSHPRPTVKVCRSPGRRSPKVRRTLTSSDR